MKKRTAIIIICALSAVLVSLGAFTLWQTRMLINAERVNEIYAERALNQLSESLVSMDEALQKSLYATSEQLFSRLCTEAAAHASTAVTALGSLPYSTHELEKTSKFINGAGDYVLALSRAAAEGDLPDDEGMENIARLSGTLTDVAAGIAEVRLAVSDSALCLDEYGCCADDGAEDTVGCEMQLIEDKLPDYPELIYDGQFSALAANAEEEAEISKEEAKRAAALFLGVPEQRLAFQGTSEGELPCWHFCLSTQEEEEQTIEVAMRSGAIVEWTNSHRPFSGSVTDEQASATAADFLALHGYGNMQELSRKTIGGVCEVSFAYSEGDVLCLTDMVNVSVALDNGEVCAFNAEEYQKNHRERELEPAVSPEGAASAVPDSLEPVDLRLVFTRLSGQKQYLCYQISCKNDEGGKVIIYLDAQNGEQKMIELDAV